MLPLLAFAAMSTEPGTALHGHWTNPTRSVIIAVTECGEAALCGRVQWASDAAKADARRGGTDPLVGTELLSDFVPNGTGRWKGRLFIPDFNKRSKAELIQLGPDQMKITGCVIGGLVCKSQVWTRSPD